MGKTILAVAVGPQKDRMIRGNGDVGDARPYVQGLIDGLAKRNRQLGTDYEIAYRERDHAEFGKKATAAKAFSARAEAPPDLIFAMSTTALRGARDAGASTPVVFPSVSDLKADGITRGNATGVSARRSQTAGTCFERFVGMVPTLKEVKVLHKAGYPPSDRAMKLVVAAAKKRGVKVTPVAVKSADDLQKKLSALAKRNMKKPPEMGILVLPVDICLGASRMIIDVASQKGIPTFFPITDCVKESLPSALGGYGVSQRKCGELAAEHVDQILWGNAKAGSLKIKEADEALFECIVSGKAAEALGIALHRVV